MEVEWDKRRGQKTSKTLSCNGAVLKFFFFLGKKDEETRRFIDIEVEKNKDTRREMEKFIERGNGKVLKSCIPNGPSNTDMVGQLNMGLMGLPNISQFWTLKFLACQREYWRKLMI